MKKIILSYAVSMALLVWLLKWLDYRLIVHTLSTEIYIGIIATLCTGLGIWAGLRLTRTKENAPVSQVPEASFTVNQKSLEQLGISQREYEVLELLAKGNSNQEIANTLFISLNTVKTHVSRIYEKLEVNRRTQAVQEAKEKGLIP